MVSFHLARARLRGPVQLLRSGALRPIASRTPPRPRSAPRGPAPAKPGIGGSRGGDGAGGGGGGGGGGHSVGILYVGIGSLDDDSVITVGQAGRGGSGGAPAFFSLPPAQPGADGIARATYDYGDIEAFVP